jgi:VanZ family protein
MKTYLSKWIPVLLMMLVIFWFSAQPASELPTFNWADSIIKKGGHMLGFGLLALFSWRALDFQPERRWIAWTLTVFYALMDEFHQSFVPGRNPSIWDVIIFDNLGALISLWLTSLYTKERRPGSIHPVAEDEKR